MLRFADQLGDVQQRFRRNAASVQANAARIQLRVDERNLHSQVGSEKRGSVASWPGAYNGNLQVSISH